MDGVRIAGVKKMAIAWWMGRRYRSVGRDFALPTNGNSDWEVMNCSSTAAQCKLACGTR